ncbi:MAG TPA: alpha/beta fold hydrolase [Actinomycetales bacterium]|nr:alpha/beta fold hydrolase [Actinomycetales bacterium]
MSSFVLVHGAWGGGWAWKKVIPLLRAAGHEVHAATATGLGDRVHLAGPAVDLDTHITDVVNVLAFEDLTEVTLVGWSYGGMIITGVAERVPERLAQLVYLDALVPADGETSYDAERSSEEVRAGDRAAADAAGLPGFLLVEPYLDWLGSLTAGVRACGHRPQQHSHLRQPCHRSAPRGRRRRGHPRPRIAGALRTVGRRHYCRRRRAVAASGGRRRVAPARTPLTGPDEVPPCRHVGQ